MLPKDKKLIQALQDAPKLVVSTVALMEELTQLLKAEIDVVTQRRTKEHPDLLKRKQRLAVEYRANMKSIADHPDVIKALPDEAKEAVRTASKSLTEAAESNARMLRAAVDATKQLVHNVMAMVRNEALPKQTYKNHAKAHLQLGMHSPTCRPVAISRTV